MDAERTVLVVDRSDDTREVLKTVLESKGLRLLEARHARVGIELAVLHQPDLILLDVEADDCTVEQVLEPLAETQRRQTPIVIIGSVRKSGPDLLPGEFVTKPYHYGPLFRRIEELLNAAGQTVSPSV